MLARQLGHAMQVEIPFIIAQEDYLGTLAANAAFHQEIPVVPVQQPDRFNIFFKMLDMQAAFNIVQRSFLELFQFQLNHLPYKYFAHQ